MSRRSSRSRWLLVLLIAGIPLPAMAQAQKEPRVEVTPFAGLRFWGEFDDNRHCCFDDPDFEADDGESFGLILDVAVSRHVLVELLWSTQDTQLLENGDFFGGGSIYDLDIDYFHVGAVYQWVPGQVRPFVVVSAGATVFNPDDPYNDSETRFSMGFGGGVKIMPSRNFGLRLEARLFSTVIDDEDEYCHFDYCYREEGEYFFQGEILAGVVLAF